MTEQFELPYRLILFDVDGTLRRCTIEGQPCPNKPGEWEILPGVREFFDGADWQLVDFGFVSNQAGVALGYLSRDMAFRLLLDSIEAATGRQPYDQQIQMCPHAPNAGCNCRKPEPGMLEWLMDWCCVGPERTLMVGDMESDRKAAINAGCSFMWADEFFKRGDHHEQ